MKSYKDLTDFERGTLSQQLDQAKEIISLFTHSEYVYPKGSNGYSSLYDCIKTLDYLSKEIQTTK